MRHRHDTEEFRKLAEDSTILRCLVGSGAHGLSVSDQDDRDEMGICIEPPDYVIGLQEFEQYEHHTAWERPGGRANRSGPGDLDVTIYSLRKYLRLALAGNPTILLPLFVPDEHTITITSLGRELRALTPVIVSKNAGRRFLGYMDAQRRSLLSRDGKGRDVTRPELIEQYGFDTKFCAHMVRLGWQGIELMKTGQLILPLAEDKRQWLTELRTGQHTLADALHRATAAELVIRELLDTSPLPDQPDYTAAGEWLVSAYQRAWSAT